MTPGKVVPQNLQAEKCVLGCILLDNATLPAVTSILTAEDFYAEAHRAVFTAMIALHQAHVVVDLLTLTAKLEDTGTLDRAGGRSAVAELTEFVPTASHVEEYAAIVYDKATKRRLIHLGSDIAALGFDADADATALREKAEYLVMDLQKRRSRAQADTVGDVVDETYEQLADALESTSGAPRFIYTGFGAVDGLLNGLEPTDLFILAARPAMGKTSLALSIALNVARAGKHVGVFSLEMGRHQLVNRLLSSLSGVDGWKLRAKKLNERELDAVRGAMSQVHGLPLYIVDTSSVTLSELRSRARKLQLERGLDFLVIDYVQLLSAGDGRRGRTEEVSEISRGLKALAKELSVPILALSQLSRAVESRDNKVPNLSDLRESGSLEQDADLVAFIYRDDYYREISDRPGEAELHVRKNRNGPTGKVLLAFDKATTTFRGLDTLHVLERPDAA